MASVHYITPAASTEHSFTKLGSRTGVRPQHSSVHIYMTQVGGDSSAGWQQAAYSTTTVDQRELVSYSILLLQVMYRCILEPSQPHSFKQILNHCNRGTQETHNKNLHSKQARATKGKGVKSIEV